ncbi:RidA family protein [Mycolicibacterium sp. 050158]|uniref:RidA family protein n=1 Tax=Mycolicibacterium sp. 050158 TaxID=3090602 RepID=UPI00299D69D5|nr:RidA family protein [Mycolicibacterium sp. 050158]MDX1888117.1 RidA family protein [Mycolicibacterium sp. 050158]
MTSLEVVRTGGRTVGYYTPAVVCPPGASLVMISGVLSVDLDANTVGAGDFEAQMRNVFHLLGQTLEAAGSSFAELAKMTTYLVDPAHVEPFYRIREEIFADLFPGQNPPGNTLLIVQRLVRADFLIEIEGIAVTSTTTRVGDSNEFVG